MKLFTILLITFLSICNTGCDDKDNTATQNTPPDLKNGIAKPYHQDLVPVGKAQPLTLKLPKDKNHEDN